MLTRRQTLTSRLDHLERSGKAKADQLVQLAQSYPLTDGGLRTSALLAQALVHDTQHHDARILRERLHQMFVPRWHFPMMADGARNRAYAQTIAATVKPGDIVLDIGCGAGLTAMLAARAGAKHVYTCENQPLIAATARRVIAANGLSDRITVLSKWSHEIILGLDMPEPADIVISEIVDTVLLGEGALSTLKHAMGVLAKPGARAIPEQGTLMAQLVESEDLLDLWRPMHAEGFDLSPFHHFATVAHITPGEFAAIETRALGPTTALFDFDFRAPDTTPIAVTRDLEVDAPGTAHAILASFSMRLCDGVTIANGIHDDGHWGRTAYLLDSPMPIEAGELLTVYAEHDSTNLSVSAENTPWRNASRQEACASDTLLYA